MKEKGTNFRLIAIIVILIALIVGGMFYLKKQNDDRVKKTNSTSYAKQLDGSKLLSKNDVAAAMKKANYKDISKDDIIDDIYDGPKDAKVKVIVWEDFACAHCQSFHEYAKEIREEYKDRVLFIERNFSLEYPNSEATISLGIAVKKLGGNKAYWKVADELFKDDTWTGQAIANGRKEKLFKQYAKAAGVDYDKVNSLLASVEDNGIQDKIDRDKVLGEDMDVQGTPTWMVNGKKVDELQKSSIEKKIDEALKKAGQKTGAKSDSDSRDSLKDDSNKDDDSNK